MCVCVHHVYLYSSFLMQALLQRNAKKQRSPGHIVQYNVKITWVVISGGLRNLMSFGLELKL